MKVFFLKNYNRDKYIFNNNLNIILLKILKLYRKKNNFFINFPRIYRKNSCIETGNTRSIYRDFSLSRMNLKESLNFKKINGLKKISW